MRRFRRLLGAIQTVLGPVPVPRTEDVGNISCRHTTVRTGEPAWNRVAGRAEVLAPSPGRDQKARPTRSWRRSESSRNPMTPSSPRVPCGALDRVTRIFQNHETEECASHPRTAGLGPGEGGGFPLAVTRSPGDGSVNRYPNPWDVSLRFQDKIPCQRPEHQPPYPVLSTYRSNSMAPRERILRVRRCGRRSRP